MEMDYYYFYCFTLAKSKQWFVDFNISINITTMEYHLWIDAIVISSHIYIGTQTMLWVFSCRTKWCCGRCWVWKKKIKINHHYVSTRKEEILHNHYTILSKSNAFKIHTKYLHFFHPTLNWRSLMFSKEIVFCKRNAAEWMLYFRIMFCLRRTRPLFFQSHTISHFLCSFCFHVLCDDSFIYIHSVYVKCTMVWRLFSTKMSQTYTSCACVCVFHSLWIKKISSSLSFFHPLFVLYWIQP